VVGFLDFATRFGHDGLLSSTSRGLSGPQILAGLRHDVKRETGLDSSTANSLSKKTVGKRNEMSIRARFNAS
jgi:hypothetical protein